MCVTPLIGESAGSSWPVSDLRALEAADVPSSMRFAMRHRSWTTGRRGPGSQSARANDLVQRSVLGTRGQLDEFLSQQQANQGDVREVFARSSHATVSIFVTPGSRRSQTEFRPSFEVRPVLFGKAIRATPVSQRACATSLAFGSDVAADEPIHGEASGRISVRQVDARPGADYD